MARLETTELVATIRTKAEISQEELARRLGVSFASVNAWERGRTEPRAMHRLKLDSMGADLGIRQGLRLVVIDDEPDVVELVETMVRAIEPDALITTATSGTDGLLACGALKPDLVLLDVMMPNLNGLEVAEAMSRVEGLEDTVLVFVTGASDAPVLEQAERVAARVVVKPITRQVLLEVLGLVDGEDTRRIGDLATNGAEEA